MVTVANLGSLLLESSSVYCSHYIRARTHLHTKVSLLSVCQHPACTACSHHVGPRTCLDLNVCLLIVCRTSACNAHSHPVKSRNTSAYNGQCDVLLLQSVCFFLTVKKNKCNPCRGQEMCCWPLSTCTISHYMLSHTILVNSNFCECNA